MTTYRKIHRSAHRMISRHDPEVGQLFVPNLQARVPNELGGYTVRTNADGFRSDVEFQKAKRDRPRILFFGDSFTAGDLCANEQRFAELVGEQLGAEIFNYAMPGSGPDQQLLVFEQHARDVEADLIVLCIYAENIDRIMASGRESVGGRDPRAGGRRIMVPKPYFTLEGGTLELHNVPVPLERPVVEDHKPERGGLLSGFPRLRRHAAQARDRFPALASVAFKAISHDPYPGYQSEDTPDWKLMAAILDRFADVAGDRPLLLVPIPEFRQHYYKLEPHFQRRFESLASNERGVHVANIAQKIYEMPREEQQALTFETDPHYCPSGHQRVAGFLTEEIRARGLAPARGPRRAQAVTTSAARTHILGISCFYHNSAAALVTDGRITAAAEEERFTRTKNDRGFPHAAINYCLEEAGIEQDELTAVVYYDNAALTFERLMHTLLYSARDGDEMFLRSVPQWVRQKLHLPTLVRRYLHYDGPVLQDIHHRSHAASAFFPSPFAEAAILTIDGVGEWATASIGVGRGQHVELRKELRFPHSLGLLYSAFTQFTGFKVNSGEYKMMGLAPYGRPLYVDVIRDHMLDLKDDGSIELNMEYFGYLSKASMVSEKFAELFDGPAREPESLITRREMDIARSIQEITEEAVLRMARHAHELTGMDNLCMAGGVALNCVANGRLLREGPFDDIWIQPAAGDSGAALGAALDAYHTHLGKPRQLSENPRPQGGSFLGPAYSDEEIRSFLDSYAYPYRVLAPEERASVIAEHLAQGRVVGHFSGRLEFGPRSLGSRSILGDPRNPETQVTLNRKIKYRESFRPFAPAVLAEEVSEYFEIDRESPYMLLVAPVKKERCVPFELDFENEDLLEQVRKPRSDVPAITHVDYSARVQTVRQEDHPRFHDVIKAFSDETGCGVVVNTSFNVRGEPIVCTPYDAYRCFMRTEMDVLVLGSHLLIKEGQPPWPEAKGHIEEHDDPSGVAQADAFLEELRRIFRERLAPAARELQDDLGLRVETDFRASSTVWTDIRETEPAAALFRYPGGVDRPTTDPQMMAAAVCESWSPGEVTDTVRPILAAMFAANVDHPAATESDDPGHVSEYIYEMY